jgi:hypothetical protein
MGKFSDHKVFISCQTQLLDAAKVYSATELSEKAKQKLKVCKKNQKKK